MKTMSAFWQTWMVKQQLNLVRKFVYDSVHETTRLENFGSIVRSSDLIVSGGTVVGLINTAQYWNKFLSDKSNLRKTATLQLGIGIENTIARAGVARAGITVANLTALKAGSVISSGKFVPMAGEWLDILTGWGDDPIFVETSVSVAIRDKFAGLFEKTIGSKDSPVDYYTSAYNPADLAWDILVSHGGLDSTASTANTDIDYTAWSTWKTACSTANLSLSGRLTGETIREAMELIRDLTNSDISVDGSGLVTFLRRAKGVASGTERSFNTTNAADFVVKLDDSKIVNYHKVLYDREVSYDLVTNGSMEADANWTDEGTPPTNERSVTQVYKGTYSRKIITDVAGEGAYQDVTTVPGVEYRAEVYSYVAAGDAKVQVRRTFGKYDKGGTADTVGADKIIVFEMIPRAAGVLDGFWIYVKKSNQLKSLQGALYVGAVGSEFAAQTDALATNSTLDRWILFQFEPNPPNLAAGITYHLAFWSDDAAMELYYDAGTGIYRWKAEAFGAWPDPLTYDGSGVSRDYSIYGQFTYTNVSGINTSAVWTKLSTTFIAADTQTRIMLLSQDVDASTIYFDEAKLKWVGPEHFNGSYLKEDGTSQGNFGKSININDGTVIWHNTLASATSFADRRIEVFKNPLEVIQFTAFMEGQIAELGDIIKVTNAFFSYSDKYFRIYKIHDINLAAATIRLEAADFDDIS